MLNSDLKLLHSIETKRSLDYLGKMVVEVLPGKLRLICPSEVLATATLARLPLTLKSTLLNSVRLSALTSTAAHGSTKNQSFANVLPESAPIKGIDEGSNTISLYPFSLDQFDITESANWVIGCMRNSLSYKTLRYGYQPHREPLQPEGNIWIVEQRLKKAGYQVREAIGLYHPAYLFWLGLGYLARRYHSSAYFQFTDKAIQRYYTRTFWWRVSYIVLLKAERKRL